MANYDNESQKPSAGLRVANAAAETAKGAGIGALAMAAVVVGVPLVSFALASAAASAIGFVAATAVSLIAVTGGLFFAPLVFGTAAGVGALFGMRKGIEQNEGYGHAPDHSQARAVAAAQEQQIALAEQNYLQTASGRSSFMAAAPVFVAANGNCPNCQVNSIDYQGQKQTGLQAGLAG